MSIPRKEYPRPHLVRDEWTNLNGQWDFEIDNDCIGVEKQYFLRESFNRKISVPFCPESVLSGVGVTDFMNCVWYRKDLDIPSSFKNKNIILHFGAVDYKSLIYINGVLAKTHVGGYSSFSVDITKYLKEAETTLPSVLTTTPIQEKSPQESRVPKRKVLVVTTQELQVYGRQYGLKL